MTADAFQARVPWPRQFPTVVIHADIKVRDSHPAYRAAKSGSADDALNLAVDLISDKAVAELAIILGKRPALLLPVTADEVTGFNAIPDAMAHVIGRKLNLRVVAGDIVQTNKVGHTRAPAFQRLVTPAYFAGQVVPDAGYVLVDDHVGLGGTLANLRGHIEVNGAHVIAMTTLTESRNARQISMLGETHSVLWEQYGESLDTLWRFHFGHGIDCLTEVEAINLCRQPSLVAIEDFLAQAAVEARGRGLEPAI